MRRDHDGNVYHPANEGAADINEQAAARAEIERGRWEKIMLTQDGRWVMWQLIEEAGYRGVVGGERSAGIHSVGISIAEKLRSVNIELYHKMIVENDR